MPPASRWRAVCASFAFAVAVPAPGHAVDATQRSCGTVRIASMNWASAETMAAIDRFILQHGYGCNAVLVPGDTMPTFESMTRHSEPDVAPEVFVNQFRDEIDKAVAQRRIDYGAKVLVDGSQEGFWIPRYLADAHPEIVTLSDALKRPDLFKQDSGSKGAVRNCPSGWGCEIMVENLFRAYDAGGKGFELVESRTSSDLDKSIEEAFAERRGWLGYYWSPTAIMGRYPMKKLAFDAPFDAEEWKRCTTQADCVDPKPNAWTHADVYTLLTVRLENASPGAASYLSRRAWDNATVNRILVWKDENRVDGEAAALHFLKTNSSLWRRWVTPEVAERVEGAL